MVPQPETHYVKGPEGNIAYQVFGDGSDRLGDRSRAGCRTSTCCGRSLAGYVDELNSRRLPGQLRYDKIGTGLSDPLKREATLENRTDEVSTVLDAADSQRPAMLGSPRALRSAV